MNKMMKLVVGAALVAVLVGGVAVDAQAELKAPSVATSNEVLAAVAADVSLRSGVAADKALAVVSALQPSAVRAEYSRLYLLQQVGKAELVGKKVKVSLTQYGSLAGKLDPAGTATVKSVSGFTAIVDVPGVGEWKTSALSLAGINAYAGSVAR